MNVHAETDRFILRDIEPNDAEGIFLLDSDPDVHEFLGKRPIKSMVEAENIIQHIRAQYDKNGIGRWAIIDKETNDFVGWTGLKHEEVVRNAFNYYDLGYRLRKEYWGKGIATETSLASLKYGFETMGLKEIGAAADVNHVISNKILQKVGLTFVETFEFEGDLCNWYRITLGEWVGC